ncbi:MAG: hypothetical protein ACRDZ3_07780 [Acidimicrobiia bacterium]
MTSAEPVVEMVTGTPAPPLRRLVGTYVGYRQEGIDQQLHRGLPSRHLTIVLSLDRPLELAGCTPATWMAEELPFVQDQGDAGGASSAHDN